MDRPPSFKFAYRTLVTPGVVFLVICITCVLAILFTFIGPFGIRRTLSISERAGFCALWGVLDLLVCYPAGVLTLYLARFRTRWQMMLAITGYALVTAAPCTAIGIAVYSLFHDGRAPVGSLILTYTVCAASLMSSTALVYHVVSLRLRIASSAAAPIADAAAAPDPDSDSAGRDGTLTGRSEAIETATAAGPALAVTADTRGDQARASGEDIEPGEAVVTIEQPAEPEPTRHFCPRARGTRAGCPRARGTRAGCDISEGVGSLYRSDYYGRYNRHTDALLGCGCRARGYGYAHPPLVLGRVSAHQSRNAA